MIHDGREAIDEADRRVENIFRSQGYLPDEVDEREWRRVKIEVGCINPAGTKSLKNILDYFDIELKSDKKEGR